ncbi:SagB family peptide dehydrogenase [Kovacikia minuta CCNUW1]|uniref:SagB family peptide dehydrogenase n=1 Tax=Kovacikia minuta TaxID=2931930 RepID=UPI001CC9A2C3|nr:SagB family peptide dehydrogenase [Kovacikia minuta]UBF28796.1 SagB family peptide dehydrogenase [Kovacikia minuta CCNUW1]
MSQQFLLSFKADVSLIESEAKGHLVLRSPNHSLTFKQAQLGLKTALRTLADGGATLAELNQMIQQDDGELPLLRFYTHLQRFSNVGWLCHSVLDEGRAIAIAIPLTSDYQFPQIEIAVESKYRLSRFAYGHQAEGQLLLESPLSQTQVQLLDWKGAALFSLLATPQSCDQVAKAIPGISLETVKQFVKLLLGAQMVSEVGEEGTIPEQTNPALAQWEFHDLLFHSRSRQGRHANSFGGTYRFSGKIEPLPAVKSPVSAEGIELPTPDLETLKTTEASFTQVLETRKSIRKYGEIPISAQQLGEFLYRCARVKQLLQTEYGEITLRPYPSGGALYELELYPIVSNCAGIAAGLYHYQPLTHQLCRISSRTQPVELLLDDARKAMGQQAIPQVLLVIAARFQRLTWKYESMAYALMLKHVGVLYQTMYLVATAMKLAPCSLGCGNSDLFTQAIGNDYYAETSVGEFVLGSQPNT